MSTQTAFISEPEILTANTYFWSPSIRSGGRRYNEEQNLDRVADFFSQIGMQVSRESGAVVGEKDGVVARFSYSESCNHVYKHLAVTRNGKNSNITQLRKLYQK